MLTIATIHIIQSLARNCIFAISTFTIRLYQSISENYPSSSYFCRSGGGTFKHNNKHRCTPETRSKYGCPSEECPAAWLTSDEEYIKFGARLVHEKDSIVQTRTIERYKIAWRNLYPREDVPLTPNGEPIDFLWEDFYKCTRIPWMKDIPISQSLTGDF